VNEPWIEAYQANNIPWDFLADFMDRAYKTVRENENVLPGNNISMVVVHDAFQPLSNWKYWFTESKGAQWVNYGLDQHSYFAWPPYSEYENYDRIVAACSMKDSLAAAQEWIPTVSVPVPSTVQWY
jgi:glucan 1,3-beta-glucosidase